MRAYTRKKDCTIHLRCDIITMGGWAFRRPREEGQGRSARYFSTALPELERINNKILGLWKL